MFPFNRMLFLGALICIVLLDASSVLAQETAAPVGLRFGRFTVSPSLRLSGGIDSNPLFAASGESADAVFSLNPGIAIAANRQHFIFQTGYNYNRIQYLENDIQNADNHEANLNLLYKSYRWSIEASDHISFTSDPADAEILERLDRTENQASVAASYFAPSRDLTTTIRYTNHYSSFDGALTTLNNFRDLVMLTSTINVSSFFHFLPKTTLNFSAEYGKISFPDAAAGDRSDGDEYKLVVGLNGRVTSKFSTLVEAGYDHLDFDVGPGSDAVVGNLVLQYSWQRLSAQLGFSHGSQESYFTNFYDYNRVIFGFKWNSFNKRWNLNDSLSYDWLDYSGPQLLLNGEARSDQVVRNTLKLTFRFMRKMDLFAEYKYAMRNSNATDPVSGATSADFSQHIGTIGLFVFY